MLVLDALRAVLLRRVFGTRASAILSPLLQVVILFLASTPVAAAAGEASPAEASPASSEVQHQAQSDGEELWYVTTIADRPVGSIHQTLARSPAPELGSPAFATEASFHMVLNRMGSQVEMRSFQRSEEDGEGRLLSLRYRLKLSGQETEMNATVEESTVWIVETVGGESFERRLEIPGDLPGGALLGPVGVERLSAETLRKEGDSATYAIFSPELGAVTSVERRVLGREEMTIEGRRIEAVKVLEKIAAAPLSSTLWLDARGGLLKSAQTGPFGEVQFVLGDAAAALAATAGTELPEESYSASLIRTPVRIPRPREVKGLKLELLHRNPALGWPDLSAHNQKVLSRSDDRLVVVVSSPSAPSLSTGDGPALPMPVTDANRPYLEPNAYLQSREPELVELAREIVGDERDPYRAGLLLERWVAENVEFDMGVVLAPSTEVLRERRGTCTEYAVVLTTLARGVGIPARFVMGYVYVAGVLGGHAWTEIRVGEEWIPLDGAVPAEGPADAARLAFQWTSLADGIGRLSSGPAAQLYGQLDVRVLEVEYRNGDTWTVPPDAVAYTVEEGVYRNPALGFEVARPEGFEFFDLDAVWPRVTLVGLRHPDGREARLSSFRRAPWEDPLVRGRALLRQQLAGEKGTTHPLEMQVGGKPVEAARGDDRAGLVVPMGQEIWLLETEGPGALELLRQLAEGFRLEAGKSVPPRSSPGEGGKLSK